MSNPLFDLVNDTVVNAVSFKVNKDNKTIDIKNKDGAVTTISFDYTVDDNQQLLVAANNFEYQLGGVKKVKDLPKIGCSGEQGNTLWLLNRYKKDYNIPKGATVVFWSWKRYEIIDFLSNHYILLDS